MSALGWYLFSLIGAVSLQGATLIFSIEKCLGVKLNRNSLGSYSMIITTSLTLLVLLYTLKCLLLTDY